MNRRSLFLASMGSFVGVSLGHAFPKQTAALRHVPITQKMVALTFDDGPDESTLELIELFAKEECRATFFVTGQNVKKLPDIARQTVAAGHELANHSWSHAKFPTLTAEQIDDEIESTQRIIQDVTGGMPTLFRAPYLKYDDNTWTALQKHKLTAINSSHGTRDYEKKATPEQVVELATKDLKPGSIILMHSFSKATLEAMPGLIRTIKQQGYRCVTVSELLAHRQ